MKRPGKGGAKVGQEAPWTSRVIDAVTGALGHPFAVAGAVALVVLWLAFGPLFHFSDTYQLIINTSTTIVTFVMVFAIQHTANRETRAINLKLDDLLDALQGANKKLVGVERKSEATIKELQDEEVLRANGHARARAQGRRRQASRSA
jgi:low affinity Fe/Cu permease